MLIFPEHLETLNWQDKTVTCNLDLEKIKSCPEYEVDKLNDADYLKAVKNILMSN